MFKLQLLLLKLIALAVLSLQHPVSLASEVDTSLKNNFIVDCKTTQSYGLNSYYLFLHQPVFDEHTKALKYAEYLLRKLKKLKSLSPNANTRNQQTIYIPVSFEPQSWVLQPEEGDFEAAARWIMHNYDYQCAKDLLASFPKVTQNGPHILSSNHMLQTKGQRTFSPWRNPVFIQNLSDLEPAKFFYWLEIFFKKSWLPRAWNESDINHLHENMLESLFQHENQLKEDIARENGQLLEIEDTPESPTVNSTENPTWNSQLTDAENPTTSATTEPSLDGQIVSKQIVDKQNLISITNDILISNEKPTIIASIEGDVTSFATATNTKVISPIEQHESGHDSIVKLEGIETLPMEQNQDNGNFEALPLVVSKPLPSPINPFIETITIQFSSEED